MKNISTADLTAEQRKAVTIDFPCAYPIKVVGQAGDELTTLISEILATLQVEVDDSKRLCAPAAQAAGNQSPSPSRLLAAISWRLFLTS